MKSQKINEILSSLLAKTLSSLCISGTLKHAQDLALLQRMVFIGDQNRLIKMNTIGLNSLRLLICKYRLYVIVIYSCWMESVKDIMQSYTEKTDGAFIEEKESMIVWNYRDTDQEFGNWQAKEMASHLDHVFCHLPIEIVHSK